MSYYMLQLKAKVENKYYDLKRKTIKREATRGEKNRITHFPSNKYNFTIKN